MAENAVALEDLYPAGSWACAHRAGDPVPYETQLDKQRVKDQGWEDKIQKPSSSNKTKEN